MCTKKYGSLIIELYIQFLKKIAKIKYLKIT